MKTKLVNKKVIFALVMSLALVLSYSSFAFATDKVDTGKIKKEAAEARQAAYEELQVAKQKAADLEANKGLSKATMDAKATADLLAKRVASEQKKADDMKNAKDAEKAAEKVVEDAEKALKDANARLAELEAATPKNDDAIAQAKEAVAQAMEDVNDANEKVAEAQEATEKLPKPLTEEQLKDLNKKADDAKNAFEAKKAAEVKAAKAEVNRLQIALAKVEKLIQRINDGKSIDPQEAGKIIDETKKAAGKADMKADAKAGSMAKGPQTGDAQDLVAYVLGLAMVSAGAVYTFRKRNLNK